MFIITHRNVHVHVHVFGHFAQERNKLLYTCVQVTILALKDNIINWGCSSLTYLLCINKIVPFRLQIIIAGFYTGWCGNNSEGELSCGVWRYSPWKLLNLGSLRVFQEASMGCGWWYYKHSWGVNTVKPLYWGHPKMRTPLY